MLAQCFARLISSVEKQAECCIRPVYLLQINLELTWVPLCKDCIVLCIHNMLANQSETHFQSLNIGHTSLINPMLTQSPTADTVVQLWSNSWKVAL